MLKPEIRNISLILALSTASLFTFGLTFHQGYLEYWGLEESMFQLSFERTLFQGFFAPVSLGSVLVVVAFAYFIILIVSDWIWRKLVSSGIWRALCERWRKFDSWFDKKKDQEDEQKDQEISPHLKNPLRLLLILSGGAATLIL